METRQMLTRSTEWKTREDGEDLIIEGYFSVFDTPYKLWDGAEEVVARGAFSGTLDNDIRALIDHETRLVLGRNTAGTLELREDDTGLWGRITINPKDQDAMNLYERVKRGDVNQCSFGFDILEEDSEVLPDGGVRWTIKSVYLYEVSVCTFPAYRETSVIARKDDYEAIKKRQADLKREEIKKILKGE